MTLPIHGPLDCVADIKEKFGNSDYCVVRSAVLFLRSLDLLRREMVRGEDSLQSFAIKLEELIRELADMIDTAETEADQLTEKAEENSDKLERLEEALRNIYSIAEDAY